MKNFYQKLKKYCSFALIAAAFPSMLGGGILMRLAIAYHQVPHPQAILTLGGDSKRSELAAQLALKNPSLDIWVSSGVRPEKADAIFQSAGVPRSRVHLDYEALDTVSNFTTMVDEFERRNIRHVYIVTSDFHMPRAKGIATFVLGSHGIAFTPVSMPTERPTEPKLFALLDMGRSMVWLVTGYSGANLNRYFSYDQLTQYFSSTNRAFFAKSDNSGEYWKQGLTARAIPCCKQSRSYKSAINSSNN